MDNAKPRISQAKASKATLDERWTPDALAKRMFGLVMLAVFAYVLAILALSSSGG